MTFIRHSPQGRSPIITINKYHQIHFNAQAIKDFRIKDFQYFILSYAKDREQIQFQFTNNPNSIGRYKLSFKITNDASATINSFCRRFNLHPCQYRSFLYDQNNNTLQIWK